MNTSEAMEKADAVACIQVDSIVYKRFAHSIKRNQPIKYFENRNPADVGHYDIIHAVAGLLGEANFYLKRII